MERWGGTGQQVINTSNAARVVHEDIVFDTYIKLASLYDVTFGEQSYKLKVSPTGESGEWGGVGPDISVWFKNKDGNSIMAEWTEGGTTTTLFFQIQDHGKRLYTERATETFTGSLIMTSSG